MKTLNTTLTESILTSLYESILSGSDTIVATTTDTVEKNIEVWDRIYDCLIKNIPSTIQFTSVEYSRSRHLYTFATNERPKTANAYRDATKELSGMENLLAKVKLYPHPQDDEFHITDNRIYNLYGNLYFKLSCNSYFETLYLQITDKWLPLVERIAESRLVSKSSKIHNVA